MKKGLFAYNKFFDENDKLRITKEGYEDILDLADIIIAKHFYINSALEKEDLKSIGVLKALEALNNGIFDKSKGSIKNYCYTGMRNEMKNYLYRMSKLVAVSDDALTTNTGELVDISNQFDSGLIKIKQEDIRKFLGRVPEEEYFVIDALKRMGFNVVISTPVKGSREFPVDKERVNFILCLIIWSRLESCQF